MTLESKKISLKSIEIGKKCARKPFNSTIDVKREKKKTKKNQKERFHKVQKKG